MLLHTSQQLKDKADNCVCLSFAANGCLAGLVDKAFTSTAGDPGLIPTFRVNLFSGPSHTSDLKIGTPVITLPSAWCYRVSTGTGWPGVSMLWVRQKVRSETSISV